MPIDKDYMIDFSLFNFLTGDATMIYAVLPAFVTLLARIVLKEPFGIFDTINIIISIVGIFFVMQPTYVFGNITHVTDDHGHFIASLAVFVGVCAAAVNMVFNRFLKACKFYEPYFENREMVINYAISV